MAAVSDMVPRLCSGWREADELEVEGADDARRDDAGAEERRVAEVAVAWT